jgi:hypothetical protein
MVLVEFGMGFVVLYVLLFLFEGWGVQYTIFFANSVG